MAGQAADDDFLIAVAGQCFELPSGPHRDGLAVLVTNGHGTVARFNADTLELRHAATTRFPDLKWDNHLTSIRADHVPRPGAFAASPPRSLG